MKILLHSAKSPEDETRHHRRRRERRLKEMAKKLEPILQEMMSETVFCVQVEDVNTELKMEWSVDVRMYPIGEDGWVNEMIERFCPICNGEEEECEDALPTSH